MFIRYASAVTSGTFMTLALFYVMQSLIAMAPGKARQASDPIIFTIGRTIVETPVAPEEPDRFRELLEPVEPVPHRPGPDTGLETLGVILTPTAGPVPNYVPGLTGLISDGPLVAMVRVEPMYPARAAEKGLEGHVTVSFDVNPDGTVSNISVVNSSHSIFEDAAIRATRKFRFKARVVDGIALATRGVQNRFVFRMERA